MPFRENGCIRGSPIEGFRVEAASNFNRRDEELFAKCHRSDMVKEAAEPKIAPKADASIAVNR